VTITLSTPDGAMEVHEAAPDGTSSPREARGAVIVIQEAFGVNDHIQDVTRRFAAAGYLGVAPALFHRAGGGTADYEDFAKVMPLFEGVSDDGVLADVDATLAHLESQGFDRSRIGIVGFCFGGRVAFLVAARRALGAAVTFYGGGIVAGSPLGFPALLDDAPALQTPWLGLFGDLDQGIPVEGVEELRGAVGGAAVAAEIVRYAEAEHGFHCDARGAYHEASAKDAWQRTLDWFATHLG
jgi:carboxymethylenebutenolidase